MDREFHVAQLEAAGASGPVIEELLSYNENVFDLSVLGNRLELPLEDEGFVECWKAWNAETGEQNAFGVLKKYLPQLSFPIREGQRQSGDYRAATLRGTSVASLPEATGLDLERPELVDLEIFQSLAGRIPVLKIRGRSEFETLVQAIAKKNEPIPIPKSQGAVMIAGYNNWERIHALRQAWEDKDPTQRENETWQQEFKRISAQRELYQDRFILLSDGPYSGVDAASLGLTEQDWRDHSLIIRRDHECTHYFTRRLFQSMRNNLLDELIADYAGLMGALGRFRADWFLRFIGLEDFPSYRPGGRLDIYRGDPPLSERAFEVLHVLVKKAAENLEQANDSLFGPDDSKKAARPQDTAIMIVALSSLRMEQLASPTATEILAQLTADLKSRIVVRESEG